jgi:hypothetical protein
VDTEYVSPALIQNYINNYEFDSAAGWTATSEYRTSINEQPSVVNRYGRFIKETIGTEEQTVFRTMTDDFLKGAYSESNTYDAYMEIKFTTP